MKISVLMPVYNTPADYLLEACRSIARQTYPADELIIVNDGSTSEETLDMLPIIERWGARVISLDKNYGISAALNYGIKAASHDWIARMDADDISFPERFEKQVAYLADNPDTRVLGTGLFAFASEDPHRKQKWSKLHDEVITSINDRWVCNHPTVMYHRCIFENISYNVSLRLAQDLDLWQKVFNAGFHIRNVPEILLAYRTKKQQ